MNRHPVVSATTLIIFVAMSVLAWTRGDIGQMALFGAGAVVFLVRVVALARHRGEMLE